MEELKDKVKRLRTALGLSQSELARRVGRNPQSIQQIEKGRTLNPNNIVEIAAALGTTPEYLKGTEPNDRNSDVLRDQLAAEQIDLATLEAAVEIVLDMMTEQESVLLAQGATADRIAQAIGRTYLKINRKTGKL